MVSKSDHKPALGAGAIAGIAVGCAVVAVFLLFCVWRARKVRRRKAAEAEGGGGDGGGDE